MHRLLVLVLLLPCICMADNFCSEQCPVFADQGPFQIRGCSFATQEAAEHRARCRNVDVHTGWALNQHASTAIDYSSNGEISMRLETRPMGSLMANIYFEPLPAHPLIAGTEIPEFYNLEYPGFGPAPCIPYPYPPSPYAPPSTGRCSTEIEAAEKFGPWVSFYYGYGNPLQTVPSGNIQGAYPSDGPRVLLNDPFKPQWGGISSVAQGILRYDLPVLPGGNGRRAHLYWSSYPAGINIIPFFVVNKRQNAFCEGVSSIGDPSFWGGGAIVDGAEKWCGCCVESANPREPWQTVSCNSTSCPYSTSPTVTANHNPSAKGDHDVPNAVIGEGIDGPFRQFEAGCSTVGNPICAATGNKSQREVDFEWAGRSFYRYYNSLRHLRAYGQIDANWQHSFSMRILTQRLAYFAYHHHRPDCDSSMLYLQTEEGLLEVFKKTPGQSNQFRSTNETGHLLSCAPDQQNKWSWIKPNGEIVTFSEDGYPTSIASPDRPEQKISLHYVEKPVPNWYFKELTHVVDARGRRLDFVYTADNFRSLKEIKSGGQTLAIYGYDQLPIRSGYNGAYLSFYIRRLKSVQTGTGLRQYLHEQPSHQYVQYPYHLTGIIDEKGQRFGTYGYDNRGRAVSSEHHGFGRVQITYLNDTTASVAFPTGDQRTYHFDPSHPFRQPSDWADGNGTVTRTYDPTTKRLTSAVSYRGNITRYQYDSGHRQVTRLVEADGTANERWIETDWNFTINRRTEVRVYRCSGQPCEPGGAATILERKTEFGYNPSGQLLYVCRKDPAHPAAMAFNCASSAVEPAGIERHRFEYCATSYIGGCGVEGSLRKIDGPRVDVADHTYYEYFQADSGPGCTSGGACEFRKGDLLKVTNPMLQTTLYTRYDHAGRPLRMLDANSVVTDFEYNARGWLLKRVTRANQDGSANSALDSTTIFDYEPYGDIRRVTSPDGDYIELMRDEAHRVIAIMDGAGNRIQYELDSAGNRVRERTTDANNVLRRNVKREFDLLGRLSKQYNANELDFARFAYDVEGNMTEESDPLGNMTTKTFDALNRPVMIIHDVPNPLAPDPDDPATTNATVETRYNASGDIVQVTDPNLLVTAYTLDGLGRRTALTSPDTGTTLYSYDHAGNLLTLTDARGVETVHAYDALNRLISIERMGPRGIHNPGGTVFRYDEPDLNTGCSQSFPVGRLTSVTDPQGSTYYCYDHRGNITRRAWVDVKERVLETLWTWTRGDRVKSLRYPSDAIVNFSRDAAGRIKSVTRQGDTTQGLVSAVQYLPFGPVSRLNLGNEESQVRNWTLDYRVSSITGPDLSLTYTQDANGNIARIDQVTGGSSTGQRFVYDDLQRLIQVQALDTSPIDRWTYDRTGNRLTHVAGGGSAVAYNYVNNPVAPIYPMDPLYGSYSHHLLARGNVSRAYDANGNTTFGAQDGLDLSYDVANRMSSSQSQGVAGSAASYGYNYLGQRVWKSGARGDELTVYDELGQILEFSVWTPGKSPSLLERTEVVWLDQLPVAAIHTTINAGTPSTRIVYLSTDHLHTPRLARETGTGTVWRWNAVMGNPSSGGSNAFGDQAASGVGAAPFTFDLRFPGQRLDAESGLHYNYFRDYEAGIGRYVESDPIGLFGGINTYAYAASHPLLLIDPTGESYAAAVGGWIAADGAVPEPSDAAWPKWAGYALAFGGALALDYCLGRSDEDECEKEWREARERCRQLIYEQMQQAAGRRKKRKLTGITGGYTDVEQCARGLVSERCGGNKVSY